jgi:hypothetical protein
VPLPLPRFTEDGVLPPGDYSLTLEGLRQSSLVQGPFSSAHQKRRNELTLGLEPIVRQLWQSGVSEIYVNGSFATNKLEPADIDVYFECPAQRIASGELLEALNAIDPHRCWTWHDADSPPEPVSGKRQLPMWWQYRVEAWPEYGQLSGQIHPVTGAPLTHAELFRITKLGQPKGIIKLIRSEVRGGEHAEN